MIRLLCPYCGAQFLRLEAVDEDEAVECPRCHRRFVPEEEEYVDPEDV
jgi:DNA-directed RNA polymerase subunit RPC12/RpoP